MDVADADAYAWEAADLRCAESAYACGKCACARARGKCACARGKCACARGKHIVNTLVKHLVNTPVKRLVNPPVKHLVNTPVNTRMLAERPPGPRFLDSASSYSRKKLPLFFV